MKVVINRCFGGFGLSQQALDELRKTWPEAVKEHEGDSFYGPLYATGQDENSFRSDPRVVKVVETLGELANGRFAGLKIVDIPDNISWHIHDYDGVEHVAQDHQTWS